MYITLSQLKDKRGITDNSQDTALQQLIDESWALIVAMGHDYTEKQHRKLISMCDLCGNSLYLDAVNVTSLDSIDGVAYTGQEDVDYFIDAPKKSKIVFVNMFTQPSRSRFIIVYTAGYSTIPEDLMLAQLYMINILEATGSSSVVATGAVKKIKLGPKEIEYDTSAEQSVTTSQISYESIFKGYRLPILTSL